MQDDSLKLKTTDESLRIDQVKGDGNCLYYATNKSHHTATKEYLGTHDELRLLTGTLTLRYLDLPEIKQVFDEEGHGRMLFETQQSMENYDATQSDLTLQALASIRNGTIHVIHDYTHQKSTHEPNTTMMQILYGDEVPPKSADITLAHRDTIHEITPAH